MRPKDGLSMTQICESRKALVGRLALVAANMAAMKEEEDD
jgi:hypothetical protein